MVENGKETIVNIDDEIPFDIPETWAWTRLGSVVIINPKNDAEDTTEVSFVPMAKIKDGLSNEFSYDIKKWGEVKKGYTHFANGDIGFAKITPCFENKKSVVFTKLKNGIGAGTTELFILRPYISRILPDFILAYVKRDAFISAGIKSFNGAVGQQRVPSEFVKNSLFPLPSTEEQARIVEKLKISIREVLFVENENNSLLKKIERTRSKLLDLAIQGKLLPQNPNDEPASVLLERIRKEQESTKTKRKNAGSYIFKGEDNLYYEQIGSEIKCIQDEIPFDIPNSWAWTRLGSIVKIFTGKKDANFATNNGKFPFFTCALTPLCCDEFSFEGESIILPGNGANVGEVIYYSGKFEAYQRTYVLQNTIFPCTFFSYVYIALKHNWKKYNEDKMFGAATPFIRLSNIENYLISLPPIQEQKRIVECISKANNQLDSMLRE